MQHCWRDLLTRKIGKLRKLAEDERTHADDSSILRSLCPALRAADLGLYERPGLLRSYIEWEFQKVPFSA
jgi:hypothetical protein